MVPDNSIKLKMPSKLAFYSVVTKNGEKRLIQNKISSLYNWYFVLENRIDFAQEAEMHLLAKRGPSGGFGEQGKKAIYFI